MVSHALYRHELSSIVSAMRTATSPPERAVRPKRKRSPSPEVTRTRWRPSEPFNRPYEMSLQTVDGTRFYVSYIVLTLASTHFRDPRLKPTPAAVLVLSVPEHDTTIDTILRLTYLITDPDLSRLGFVAVVDTFVAARKYKLLVAEAALRNALVHPRLAKKEPVRLYAIARRHGLTDVANIAADYACLTNPLTWPACDELEHITAMQYHELVSHYTQRRSAVENIINNMPKVSCSECYYTVYHQYQKAALGCLQEAPTSTEPFTEVLVLESSSKAGCDYCQSQANKRLLKKGLLGELKKQVEALPQAVQ